MTLSGFVTWIVEVEGERVVEETVPYEATTVVSVGKTFRIRAPEPKDIKVTVCFDPELVPEFVAVPQESPTTDPETSSDA